MKAFLFSILSILGLITHSQQSVRKLLTPGIPALFSEIPINTSMNERDIAISPDGNELFYTVYVQPTGFHTILYCKKDKTGKWSSPVVASFSGVFSDMEPAFTADGQRLFFSSNRADDTSKARNYDIWYVEKEAGQWRNPQNLGTPVNTPENEYFPSIAANGNLYFTASYQSGRGKEDIFMARWSDDRYEEPISLDSGVNSALYEFNAFVSPDERYIVFTSFGRKDDKGRGDLYVSTKATNGSWLPAKNLTLVNSEKLDYCPFISFDKKTLYFTSERHAIPETFAPGKLSYERLKAMTMQVQNGTGNIYQVSWDAVLQNAR